MLREFYVGEYFKENLRSVEFEGFVRIPQEQKGSCLKIP